VKIGWRLLPVQNIFNIYNNIYNSNNNKQMKVYMLLNYRRKEWRHNLLLKSLDQQHYRCHIVGQKLQKDLEILHTSTPKSVEEVVIEVMKAYKASKLY
jgi:hypothetical protein